MIYWLYETTWLLTQRGGGGGGGGGGGVNNYRHLYLKRGMITDQLISECKLAMTVTAWLVLYALRNQCIGVNDICCLNDHTITKQYFRAPLLVKIKHKKYTGANRTRYLTKSADIFPVILNSFE